MPSLFDWKSKNLFDFHKLLKKIPYFHANLLFSMLTPSSNPCSSPVKNPSSKKYKNNKLSHPKNKSINGSPKNKSKSNQWFLKKRNKTKQKSSPAPIKLYWDRKNSWPQKATLQQQKNKKNSTVNPPLKNLIYQNRQKGSVQF